MPKVLMGRNVERLGPGEACGAIRPMGPMGTWAPMVPCAIGHHGKTPWLGIGVSQQKQREHVESFFSGASKRAG